MPSAGNRAPALRANSTPPRKWKTPPPPEWTHHCAETSGEIVRESFFYAFGEPARAARLRVDLRPLDESPATTAALQLELRRRLTARFGAPTQQPEMMEIGFRHLRYGQPVNGDHWQGAGIHYFLHANQYPGPMGMRHGVQLIVITDRLFAERQKDAVILRVEGIGGEAREEDDPVRTRLKARIGEPYTRPMHAGGGAAPARRPAGPGDAPARERPRRPPAPRPLPAGGSSGGQQAEPDDGRSRRRCGGCSPATAQRSAARPIRAAWITRATCCGASGANSPRPKPANSPSSNSSAADGTPPPERAARRIPTGSLR